MSKSDDIVEADECIAQAMARTPSLSTDQLIALAQVNATKAVAHEARTLNLMEWHAFLLTKGPFGQSLAREVESTIPERLGLMPDRRPLS